MYALLVRRVFRLMFVYLLIKNRNYQKIKNIFLVDLINFYLLLCVLIPRLQEFHFYSKWRNTPLVRQVNKTAKLAKLQTV
jgi:hypothetical protein